MSERFSVAEITRRRQRIEFRPQNAIRAQLGLNAILWLTRPKLLERALAIPFRLHVLVCREFRLRNIAKIAIEIHDLVIAQQQMHAAVAAASLFLEPHDQVHDLARLRASIQQVTREYQVCLAAAPCKAAVEDFRCLKRLDQGIVGTVNITNGDDPLNVRVVPFIGVNLRQGYAEKQEQEQHT